MPADGQLMDSSSRMLENWNKINIKYDWNKWNGTVGHGLMDGCVPFSHQVAGHKCGINNTGVLQHPDGTILKQLQPPPRGPREMLFYKQNTNEGPFNASEWWPELRRFKKDIKVYAKDCTDKRLLDLQQHLPKSYGTWAPQESPHELYLKLEDVTRRFLQPCIMDVKIGRRSYDPFASQEKREQQIKKYPLMEEIGFLLLGMRVYQINSDSYITHDQSYGRSLGKDTVKNGFIRFFHNGQVLRKDAISQSIFKIQRILRWFESQRQLHFYASSLLLVYEGSPHTVNGMKNKRAETGRQLLQSNGHFPHEALSVQCSLTRVGGTCSQPFCSDLPHNIQHDRTMNGVCGGRVEEKDEEIRKEEEAVEVKMIDFAHVFPSDSPDEGYMYGLRNLLATLEQILKDSDQ